MQVVSGLEGNNAFIASGKQSSPKYEGFVVDLALELSRIIGFNFTITPTNGYGSVGKDGRWTGMIRELLEEVFFIIFYIVNSV